MAGRASMTAWPAEPPPPGDVRVAPEGTFATWAAAELAAVLCALARRPPTSVSLALAGGSTPRPVYEALATAATVPWRCIEIFFGDERAVPPDAPDSNYRMARESLLSRVPILDEHVHRMRAEARSPEEAAREYASVLPKAMDLVLLGIGSDGHTASLFPGADTLRATAAVVPAMGPVPPRQRLTMSPSVLAAAHRIMVLASGLAKADAVARALTGSWEPASCPAQLARRGTWLLDAESASRLPAGLCRPSSTGRERTG